MDAVVCPDAGVTMSHTIQAGHVQPPLVVHIIHRLAVGGLENGLVNLINSMPPAQYRHAIVCLTDYTDFRERIRDKRVPIIALHKKEGHDLGVYVRLWRVLRHLRPALVHTRNLSGLEHLVLAALARIPGRIHGEHGRDIYDLDLPIRRTESPKAELGGLEHRVDYPLSAGRAVAILSSK